MNRSLFTSWYALVAVIVAGGFVAWPWVMDIRTGPVAGSDRTFLLWSGWTALGLYLLVMAYVLRKYIHKMGISPEFRMKVGTARLEAAQKRLGAIRRQILAGTLTDARLIRDRARDALREEGVHRIVRAEVRPGADPRDPPHVIEILPTEPLGRMAIWLRAHLYLGMAAAVLVLLHGGLAWDSPMARLLNGLSLFVIGSGLVGIAMWARGPTWLTRRERELSIEKTYALDRSLARRVTEARALIDPAIQPILHDVERGPGEFRQRAEAALQAVRELGTHVAEAQDLLAVLGQHHEVKRELHALWKIRMWINAWRVVHVPVALLLVVVVSIHVFSVLWY